MQRHMLIYYIYATRETAQVWTDVEACVPREIPQGSHRVFNVIIDIECIVDVSRSRRS